MNENKLFTTVEDLVQQAEQQFKTFIKEGKYKDILLSMSNLNCYSFTNQMLILSQMPTARCVNGMKVWNYNQRNIIKGEKSIKIIAPLKETKKEEILNEDGEVIEIKETDIIGYKVAHVFDLSQTEGKPIYEFTCTEEMAKENFEIIRTSLERVPRDFTISYEAIDHADGYCDITNKKIVIKDGMSYERTLVTLIHEIGHALSQTRMRNDFRGLTKNEQLKIEEIEAESVALVVSNRLGLNTTDFNLAYITHFSDGDIEKFKNNLDVIRSISYQILSSIEPALQTELKNQRLAKKETEILKEETSQEPVQKPNKKTKKSEVEHA